jgi:hypothetical protein
VDTLVRDVIYATGLRRQTVKPAIGFVLQYLRNEAPEPEAHVDDFIGRLRQGAEVLRAAAIIGGGANAAIEGLSGFLTVTPCADADLLATRLKQLGLSEFQIVNLLREILRRAETLIGAEDVAKIRALLSSLDTPRAARSAKRA